MKYSRNAALYGILLKVKDDPHSDVLREEWINASIDLVRAVAITNFASMHNSPDRGDLEQAALLEFHKSILKFVKMTDDPTMDSTRMFRILYSVARYSMIREFTRIGKHGFPVFMTEENNNDNSASDDYEVYTLIDSLDAGADINPFSLAPVERDIFINQCLPIELLSEIDNLNMYKDTQWNSAISFCVLQLLQGRILSGTLVKRWWGKVPTLLIEDYARYLIRGAILKLSESSMLKVLE